MDSSSAENKKQTRSETSKKNIKKNDAKIPISSNSKSALKKRKGFRKAGGVIYIGHIPHGFYEDEMKSYFNQFGKVLATTVARSKKTGRSKGYGFVEFKDEEVAKIAAETMNNYLMFNKILKCRYIPPEENRGSVMERKVTMYDFPRQRNRKVNELQKAKAFSNLNQKTYMEKAQAKIEEFKKFFDQRGIDFNFEIKSTGKASTSDRKNKKTNIITSMLESKDDSKENEFAVLEIDESEDEISFKTPPHVKKVIKKSSGSPAVPADQMTDSNKLGVGKQKINLSKKSNLNKIQKKGKVKTKTSKGASGIITKLGQKSKNNEKSFKVKESLAKNILAGGKQNKEKIKSIGLSKGKAQEITKQGPKSTIKSPKPKIQISVEV